jgi:uridine kinase
MKGPDNKYIRWTDIRLIRRMLRDFAHRAYNPTQTLEHWHYVRSSEMRNIIPNINTTDYIINSGMPYEICLYNHKLIKDFRNWVDLYQNDPLKVDAFTRAKRTLQVLEEVLPLENDNFVPNDSVIREFIGGSSLTY